MSATHTRTPALVVLTTASSAPRAHPASQGYHAVLMEPRAAVLLTPLESLVSEEPKFDVEVLAPSAAVVFVRARGRTVRVFSDFYRQLQVEAGALDRHRWAQLLLQVLAATGQRSASTMPSWTSIDTSRVQQIPIPSSWPYAVENVGVQQRHGPLAWPHAQGYTRHTCRRTGVIVSRKAAILLRSADAPESQ